jgi:ADP-ribose pyrophosphatase YjhB (NUDIX family)
MPTRAQCIVHRGRKLLMVFVNDGGRTFWCLPGGRVESGETPEQAVVRELREECCVEGVVVREASHNTYLDGDEAYTYLVDIGEQTPRVGSEPEFPDAVQPLVDVQWVTLAQISERDRTFLWAAGLLSVPVFLAEVSAWGDDVSYPQVGD